MKNLEKSIEIEKNDFVVYIHTRLDKNIPFYVGKGKKYRPYDFTNRNKYWKKVYNKCNGNIRVDILYFDLSETDSLIKERETELILISEGIKLTNIVKTGILGSSGHKKSQEWKNWYSKLMSEINSNRIFTEEHRANLSISAKNFGDRPWLKGLNIGRVQSQYTRDLKNSKLKGRIQTQEEKDKRSKTKSKPILQYDLEDNLIREWISSRDFALYFNPNKEVSIRVSISYCCIGKQQTAYGFKWKYKN